MTDYTPETPQNPEPAQPTPEPASHPLEVPPAEPFGGAAVPTAAPQEKTGKRVGARITCLVLAFMIVGGAVLGLFLLVGIVGSLFEGIQPSMPHIGSASNTIAVLRIDEPIYEGQRFLKVLDHYIEKDDIPAVLVRINSPGGTVGASQELYQGIKRLRDAGKKVVVSMGSVAASGGYYAAAAADEIYSNPGTMTGSIGVIMSLPQFGELADKIGIKTVVVKSGKLKDVPSTMRPLTEEERAFLQALIDDAHSQFVDAILANRRSKFDAAWARIAREEVQLGFDLDPKVHDGESLLRFIADGRVVTGRQAQALGLVDQIGGKRDAIDALARMAGIRGKPEIYEYKPKLTFFEMLENSADSAVKQMPVSINGPSLEYRLRF